MKTSTSSHRTVFEAYRTKFIFPFFAAVFTTTSASAAVIEFTVDITETTQQFDRAISTAADGRQSAASLFVDTPVSLTGAVTYSIDTDA